MNRNDQFYRDQFWKSLMDRIDTMDTENKELHRLQNEQIENINKKLDKIFFTAGGVGLAASFLWTIIKDKVFKF